MTYKGVGLIAWARKKAAEFLTKEAGAPWMVESLEALVAESYLRGAIDALAEETELKKLGRAAADSDAASDARGVTHGR